MAIERVPHTRQKVGNDWVLVPVPSCPWCGSKDAPKTYGGGRCNNSWHVSHPEHATMWTHPPKDPEPPTLTEEAEEALIVKIARAIHTDHCHADWCHLEYGIEDRTAAEIAVATMIAEHAITPAS